MTVEKIVKFMADPETKITIAFWGPDRQISEMRYDLLLGDSLLERYYDRFATRCTMDFNRNALRIEC